MDALPFGFVPISEGAPALIRANLEAVQKGNRVRPVVIGTLTNAQLTAINEHRSADKKPSPPIAGEVVFLGSHIYNSRIVGDGYTIDDVIEQITSGMDAAAVVSKPTRMAFMDNPVPRADRYGNKAICDRVVFECSGRYPRPELYSVMPKGDTIKPKKAPHRVKGLFILSGSTG